MGLVALSLAARFCWKVVFSDWTKRWKQASDDRISTNERLRFLSSDVSFDWNKIICLELVNSLHFRVLIIRELKL